jgi:iron complex transport system ATP-binding protein
MSLELRDLSVDIAGRRIVSGINLRVADGQFAGLIGPNGSGKSTILKAIYRVHRPATGSVLVNGTDLHQMRPKLAARRVAVVAQENLMDFGFTVRELVLVGRTPHKGPFDRDNEDDQAITQDAMQRTGCADLGGRSFQSLSGGEKQRVLIARALAQGADHLVLDEPTNHLDIRYQISVLELVAGLGVTVLAAVHDLNLAALFCDTVHVLADGRLIAAGSPAEVITPETVRAAYGADVLIIDHPDTSTPQLLPRRLAGTHRPAARPAATMPQHGQNGGAADPDRKAPHA